MSVWEDIWGKKPIVPVLKPIDYNQVQKDATQQNIDILPKANELATKYNTLNQAELDRLLASNIPDIAGIKSNISKTLLSESQGELSPDVQSAVERSAIARSLGHAGGSMGGSWVARDIGKTSYDIANNAMGATERWLATTRDHLTVQPFNMTSMFVSPQQRLAQVTEERNSQFERSWLSNQIDAMPDPIAHAIWQSIDSYVHSYGGANNYSQPNYGGNNGGGGNSFGGGGGGNAPGGEWSVQ